MTRARASGTPASKIRRQKPAISSLSLRPISPASVTQALSALKAAVSINGSSLPARCFSREPDGRDYSHNGQCYSHGHRGHSAGRGRGATQPSPGLGDDILIDPIAGGWGERRCWWEYVP